MKHLDRSKFSLNQVMMTLSAIAYIPFTSILALQDSLNTAETLEKTYTAIWWGKENDTVAFVVRNNLTREHVIVFKGPVFRPGLSFLLNLYEDMIMYRQEYLPSSEAVKSRVAAGILGTLQNIGIVTYSGRTLSHTLASFPVRNKVYVTGHSLGGSLAAAFAVKTACSNSRELDIIPYTFGAPAMGNVLFANLFNMENPNSLFDHSSRCVNSRDIIPDLWNNLQAMATVDYGAVQCPVDFSLCIECMERLLIVSKVFYVQPPLQLELQGDIGHNEGFFQEALFQHQPNTYLSLLGLGPIDNAKFYRNERKELLLADSL
ncbi:MAG TPA: lipase family protein [Puia sp.]|nr:lipase family protein [Puia sp.]